MALSLCRCVSRGFVAPPPVSLLVAREASKKAGGSSKNKGGKSPGRRYGYKKLDGDFVHAGNILATQRIMRWHPGSQVGIGRNKTLFALEDGIVRYTKEVYVPPPRSEESRNVICQLPAGAIIYKTFVNVIAVPRENHFKLVEMM
ncbi:39S ribosomal protein L27, mitochondrial [Xenopus laevis]|uniref:Large ribosomal subunit protein bL27m n=1 Tax=Xenopus laevis TaxID=8355 RepID=A0A8J0TTX1_XENLA|nr:39S ribosomal protein L27, mitochondrial [Xenopus laevis]